jgi:hypothetical protein
MDHEKRTTFGAIFFEYVEEVGFHPWSSISFIIHAQEDCL